MQHAYYVTWPDFTQNLVYRRGFVGSCLHQVMLHSRQRCNCHSPSYEHRSKIL